MVEKQKLISHKIANRLRDLIHKGLLLPGNPVNLSDLCAEFGVSISPVRDAAKLLEQEGYLQVVPRRGVYVRQVAIEEILDAYDFRLAVEPVMVELAAPHITGDDLNDLSTNYIKLRDGAERLEPESFRKLDMALHMIISERCPNRIFKGMITSIVGYIEWSSSYALIRMPGAIPETVEEHLRVCRALLDRDVASASNFMREHLLKTKSRISDFNRKL